MDNKRTERMKSDEILEEIYKIYYNGKMFSKELLIDNVKKDHEAVKRLNAYIEHFERMPVSDNTISYTDGIIGILEKIKDGKWDGSFILRFYQEV